MASDDNATGQLVIAGHCLHGITAALQAARQLDGDLPAVTQQHMNELLPLLGEAGHHAESIRYHIERSST